MLDDPDTKVIFEVTFVGEREAALFEGLDNFGYGVFLWGEEDGIVNVEDEDDSIFDEQARVNIGLLESEVEEALLYVKEPCTACVAETVEVSRC